MKATTESNNKTTTVVLSSSEISLPTEDTGPWSSVKMESSYKNEVKMCWEGVKDMPASG